MALPYETLIGVSYGLLVGFLPAVSVGLLALVLVVGADRRVSPVAGLLAIPPALLLALGAGILELAAGLEHAVRTGLVGLVAGLLGVFAASQGVRVGTELPQDRACPLVRGPSLAPAAVDAVDAAGQVTIRPTGLRTFDGYPPLAPSLRTALEDGTWRFPADLQLAELEGRLARTLRTKFDLPRVDVDVDARGRATITAAPPATDLSGPLPDGTRAVPITGLVPAGVESGDEVTIGTSGGAVTGTVLAATSRGSGGPSDDESTLTVAVETPAAGSLLESTVHSICVRPDGTNPALEAVSLLEQAGSPVRLVNDVNGETLEPTSVIGYRMGDRWTFPHSSDADDWIGDAAETVDEVFVADTPGGVTP